MNDEFAALWKNSPKLLIQPTIDYLNSIEREQEFEIESNFPTINTLSCTLKRGNRSFEYSTGEILPYGPPVKFQHESYGFRKPFALINKENYYKVPISAGKISINIGDGFTSNGELWELESNFDNTISFLRAAIPISQYSEGPISFIESEKFSTEKSLKAAGYIKLEIPYSATIFDYSIDKKRFLFVDSNIEMEADVFEKLVSAIIYSYGLISGYLIRDEMYLLKFEDELFAKPVGFQYRRIEDSINGLKAIAPKDEKQIFKLSKTPYLAKEIFERIVSICFCNNDFLRSIKIITEGGINPFYIQTSTLSVALETIKNIILLDNETIVNPIKDKIIAKEIREKITATLNEYDDGVYNNKLALLKKVNNFNSIGNNDSLLLIFKILELNLLEDDVYCVKLRNDFLHGRLPFETKTEDKQLRHVVYKLHFLLCSLILKYCGFNGRLLNNLKVHYLMNKSDDLPEESIFRMV